MDSFYFIRFSSTAYNLFNILQINVITHIDIIITYKGDYR